MIELMNGLDAFLESYGLAAIFVVMLAKSAGVPVPIPADLIMLATAARAAEGKIGLGPAFVALLVALVLGGLVQFGLVRGPGRGALYRFGRYLGLTPARLDAATLAVRRGGAIGVGLAILTPGIRATTVAACGLAALPLRTFLPGLVVGSSGFLSLHFVLGYLGGPLVLGLLQGAPLPWLAGIGLLVLGLVVWWAIRRRQRPSATGGEVVVEAVGAWHEATCPACLALGAARGRL
jgi:membrane protein DedA with SNARE-associated domain